MSQEIIRNAYTQAGLLAIVTHSFCADPAGSQLVGGSSIRAEVGRAIWCWTIVVITLLGLGFATKTSIAYSRVAMSLWFVVTPILLGLARILVRVSLRAARDRGYNQRVGAVVGSGPLAQQVSQTLIENPSFGIVSKGHFDDTGRTAGTLDELVAPAPGRSTSCTWRCCSSEPTDRNPTDRLQNSTAPSIVPDLLVFDLIRRSTPR